MKKKVVIISGVTGAIGSPLLDLYAREANAVVYGISRKALPYQKFLDSESFLPLSSIIFSTDTDDFGFVRKIDFENVREVVYVHALGLYPFEITPEGTVVVENDLDGDGVNDECEKLTFKLFSAALQAIRKASGDISFTAILFGGLADRHHPLVHQSWWRTIEKTKAWARDFVRSHANMKVLCANIASVLCPHELITRPFVFIKTDADPKLWLSPYALATTVVQKIATASPGFCEFEHFLARPNFDPKYYSDEQFTPRKMQELF